MHKSMYTKISDIMCTTHDGYLSYKVHARSVCCTSKQKQSTTAHVGYVVYRLHVMLRILIVLM
jgi:hypothetical protein